MKIGSLATKTFGILTASILAYDAHKCGTMNSTMKAKRNVANSMVDHYIHSNQISKPSTIEANSKKAWFRFVMDNNIGECINSVLGYVGGVVGSFVDNIIPASLATGAIICGPKKAPMVGKLCSLGLLAYGLKFLLYDVMSVGKKNYLKEEI